MESYSKSKKVLLIAGGGSIGTYTYEELLRLGHCVDVICLDDKISDNERLKFYKENATYDFLEKLFEKNHYDAIVDFLFYGDVEEYKKSYSLLAKNTEHLVFLSSYRVYADSVTEITETSPKITDVIKDEEYLSNETYAIPKIKCEEFLKKECKGQNWTIVRPVISFSKIRLDMLMYSGLSVLEYAQSGKELILPIRTKNLTAGLDWAGNTGKLIANLLFKPNAIGECYTISSAPNLTWGQIADIYSEVIGLKVKWTDEETFLQHPMFEKYQYKVWGYFYDRVYNRKIDNSKILNVTGLKKDDFKSIKDGIRIEIDKINSDNNR